MLYNANPVFSAPPGSQVRDAIAKVPYIVSFGSFLDETSSLADLILPDNAPLESWLDDVPESGAAGMVASLAAPAVHPLHDTRAMPDVLLDLAHGLGGNIASAVPYKTYDEMLRAAFVPLRKRPAVRSLAPMTTTISGTRCRIRAAGGMCRQLSQAVRPAPLSARACTALRPSSPIRNLMATPPLILSTFCPTPRRHFETDRWPTCHGCRKCRTC